MINVYNTHAEACDGVMTLCVWLCTTYKGYPDTIPGGDEILI